MAIYSVVTFLSISSLFYTTLSDDREGWWDHVVPENYTKLRAPSVTEFNTSKKNSTVPTKVRSQLYPHLIASVSMIKMDFEMDLTLSVQWIDSRLMNPEKYLQSDMKTELILPEETVENIWLPSLRFVNCIGCRNSIINPKERKFYINWNQTIASVWVNVRKMFKFTCEFDLRLYPFDTQKCSILLQTMNPYQYVHLVAYVATIADIHDIICPPEFKLEKISYFNCSTDEVNYENFRRNCRKFTFALKRQLLPHLMLTFVPSMLIVILSWISFWLDAEAAGPRVALGLTSLLTLATQFNKAQDKLPATEKLKALDVWMFACIFTVFASLLEFAISNYCHRRFKQVASQINSDDIEKSKREHRVAFMPRKQWLKKMKTVIVRMQSIVGKRCAVFRPDHPKRIDQISRAFFPLSFGIFNLNFWTYYV